MHHTQSSTPARFLSFALGGLEYGIDFAKVQELRVLKALERFAAAGEIVGGVAVSRGVIMPLVDMRVAFGSSPDAPDPMTRRDHPEAVALHDGDGGRWRHRRGDAGGGAGGGGAGGGAAGLPDRTGEGGRRLILVDIERLMSVKGTALCLANIRHVA
jgi:purine-binding chemotaxis protein CheW